MNGDAFADAVTIATSTRGRLATRIFQIPLTSIDGGKLMGPLSRPIWLPDHSLNHYMRLQYGSLTTSTCGPTIQKDQ